MLVDQGPPKQQMVGRTSIYNVESTACSYMPYGQITIDVQAESN